MSEGSGALINAAPWAPAAIGFLVGLACGFAFWGIRSSAGDNVEDPLSKSDEAGLGERKEIIALRAELEATRALLNDSDQDQEELGRQLSAVDEALKRANGRLKILLRSLKR